jgi:hypothetical protein
MEKEKEHLQQLQEIRSLMERSTKFVSLSGISGIAAGCIALAGAYIQYRYMDKEGRYLTCFRVDGEFIIFSIINFLSILILALFSAYYFTQRKAKKNKQSVWDSSSKRLMMSLATPLACGGLFCGVLYLYGLVGLIASSSLIFYGLALVSGSNFTLRDIRYLGFVQIALGFVAAYYIGFGLLFWALGFGVLHIVYGIVMYVKYDRNNG